MIMGIEDCPRCQSIDHLFKINSEYFEQINLSDLKFFTKMYSLKLYSYLQISLENTAFKLSNLVSTNFDSEKIFRSLFGKYRKRNTGIMSNKVINNSLLIDFFIFISNEMNNRYDLEDYVYSIPFIRHTCRR